MPTYSFSDATGIGTIVAGDVKYEVTLGPCPASPRHVWNFLRTYVKGTLISSANDDVAPLRIYDEFGSNHVVGGNHGWVINGVQIVPSFQKRVVTVWADDVPCGSSAKWINSLKFVERYEILPRSVVASGETTGRALIYVCHTYEFLPTGMVMIHTEYTANEAMTLSSIGGIQMATPIGAVVSIPKTSLFKATLPEDAVFVSDWFDGPADTVIATGEIGGQEYFMATGYLTGPRFAVRAWEWRNMGGNQGKVYPSLTTAKMLASGDSVSFTAFRAVGVPPSDQPGLTAQWSFQLAGVTYATWHWSGVGRTATVPLPLSAVGRTIDLVAQKNCVLRSARNSGTAVVSVSTTGTDGFLTIRAA